MDMDRSTSSIVSAALRIALMAGLALTAIAASSPDPARPTAPAATATGASPGAPAAPSAAGMLDRARQARVAEEGGLYTQAADILRDVRARVAPDADLDLALALDEARTGRLGAAAELLWTPLMDRALADTTTANRHFLPWIREPLWVNGRFDGWSWYVARARFEVAYSLRRWPDALAAARACVLSRPLSGSEWLALSLAAGRAGEDASFELAARRAMALDPTLPEARYLAGLASWRAGQRREAESCFRAAIALDSLERRPAVALMRVRMPGALPDTLPAGFLRGPRATMALTSPARPKLEEFQQYDMPARLARPASVPLDSAWLARMTRFQMVLPVLVDERGRAVANQLPWITEDQAPGAAMAALVGSLPGWVFTPAMKGGVAHRSWVVVPYRIE
jgi:hypothetical protein